MISRFRTFIAGFLVLLPLAVTFAVIVWVGSLIFAYLGPGSAIGGILLSIGFNFSDSPAVAYALGAIVVVGLVYLLGVAVESRLESRIRSTCVDDLGRPLDSDTLACLQLADVLQARRDAALAAKLRIE